MRSNKQGPLTTEIALTTPDVNRTKVIKNNSFTADN